MRLLIHKKEEKSRLPPENMERESAIFVDKIVNSSQQVILWND
jgi:hypothetical protein